MNIFIDDLNVTPPNEGSWSEFGNTPGFMAALVHDESTAKMDQDLRLILSDACRDYGIALDELHGDDIASGRKHWKGKSIDSRVCLLTAVLRCAQEHDVHFIFQLSQEGRPELDRVLRDLYRLMPSDRRQANVEQWKPPRSTKLALIELTRRCSVFYAVQALGANRIVIWEDENIPIDDARMRHFAKEKAEQDIAIETKHGQDSKNVPGIQLADIAATVLRLGTRISRNLESLKEGVLTEDEVLNSFAKKLIEHDTVDLLEFKRRTHSALALDYRKLGVVFAGDAE